MSAGSGKSSFTPVTIKKEPLTNTTNGLESIRLSSFGATRDLTLGGAGPVRGSRGGANKKVFTPNLNVVRNKNTNVKTSKDTSARGKNRAERGKSERGRGGRGRGGFIQTSGVFSEGAGAINIRKSTTNNSYRSSGGGGDDESKTMRKPTITKKEAKIDLKADALHIKELLGDSENEGFDDLKTDLEYIPVKLCSAKLEQLQIKLEKIDPDKVDVKDELCGSENSEVIEKLSSMRFTQDSLANRNRYPTDLDEFFTRQLRSQLFLLKLPDSLPCEESEDNLEKPCSSKDATTNSSSSTQGTKCLKDMEEGQIGKIVRYKSGKCKLILGESHFNLDLGIPTRFLQELMSINTNREERSGNMVNLGPIQAKLTAIPDWERLLKDKS